MKKIYYLKTCNTCTRFLQQIKSLATFALQDLKEQPLKVSQLEELRKLTDSYESLFSRRAKLYREMGLHERSLTEDDYRHYILQHYTFLKRPVVVADKRIFIGANAKNIVEINQISTP